MFLGRGGPRDKWRACVTHAAAILLATGARLPVRARERVRTGRTAAAPACPGWASPAHKGFAGRKPRASGKNQAPPPFLCCCCTLLEFSFFSFLCMLSRRGRLSGRILRAGHGLPCSHACMHGCMHCVRACMHACFAYHFAKRWASGGGRGPGRDGGVIRAAFLYALLGCVAAVNLPSHPSLHTSLSTSYFLKKKGKDKVEHKWLTYEADVHRLLSGIAFAYKSLLTFY